MTKTLGRAALQLYSMIASMFLPIPTENELKLVADPEADPFAANALSGATCYIHQCDMFLASLPQR